MKENFREKGSLYSCTNKNRWSVSIRGMNKENNSDPHSYPQRRVRGDRGSPSHTRHNSHE